MKFRWLIFLAAIFCAVETGGAAATNDFFAQGLALDRAGQFPEAAAAFENSIKQKTSSGASVAGIASNTFSDRSKSVEL